MVGQVVIRIEYLNRKPENFPLKLENYKKTSIGEIYRLIKLYRCSLSNASFIYNGIALNTNQLLNEISFKPGKMIECIEQISSSNFDDLLLYSNRKVYKQDVMPLLENVKWFQPNPYVISFMNCSDFFKNSTAKQKVAFFDINGTLIVTKSKTVFPIDRNDWKFLFDNVVKKVREKYFQGFLIVFITNQMHIFEGRKQFTEFRYKMQQLSVQFNIPIMGFIAPYDDYYRKPFPGMLEIFTNRFLHPYELDYEESFFVGDAAGRPKDFASFDYQLSLNFGIKFLTPEAFFKGEKMNLSPKNMSFDPVKYIEYSKNNYQFNLNFINPAFFNMIILVGFPGCGKTTFFYKFLEKNNFVHINIDILENKSYIICWESLKRGYNVVIDDTNPSVESRGKYISLAKQLNYQVSCVEFMVSKQHAMHNNSFRNILGGKKLLKSAYASYLSRFRKPSLAEGFRHCIEYIPQMDFENSEMERVYKMFLID